MRLCRIFSFILTFLLDFLLRFITANSSTVNVNKNECPFMSTCIRPDVIKCLKLK